MWYARTKITPDYLVKSLSFISRRYLSKSNNQLTTISFSNGVKTITMCDAKTRNSMTINMMDNLIQNISDDQNKRELRVIILAAEGHVFSAGHNLKELDAAKEVQERVFEIASNLMKTIIDAPVPVIAKVDGLAAAAGCQLVGQCDLAFCTERSTFSTPGANFGIFCSTPGVALARSIPKSIALKMLLTGQPISSAEAKLHGLVSDVFTSNLDEEVNKICETIKAKSRSVVELGKRFYYKQVNVSVKEAYDIGGKTMVENLQIPDGHEGIRSFKEKRRPVWSHITPDTAEKTND